MEYVFDWVKDPSSGQWIQKFPDELYVPLGCDETKKDALVKSIIRGRAASKSKERKMREARRERRDTERTADEAYLVNEMLDEDEMNHRNYLMVFDIGSQYRDLHFIDCKGKPHCFLWQASFTDPSDFHRTAKNGMIQCTPTDQIPPVKRGEIPQHDTGETRHLVDKATRTSFNPKELIRTVSEWYPKAARKNDYMFLCGFDPVSSHYKKFDNRCPLKGKWANLKSFARSTHSASPSMVLRVGKDTSGKFSVQNQSAMDWVYVDFNMHEQVCYPINHPDIKIGKYYMDTDQYRSAEGVMETERLEEERGRQFLIIDPRYREENTYKEPAVPVVKRRGERTLENFFRAKVSINCNIHEDESVYSDTYCVSSFVFRKMMWMLKWLLTLM